MAEYSSVPVCRELEIPIGTSAIDFEITKLEEIIKELKERLIPVRSCREEIGNTKAIEPVKSLYSPLANVLCSFSERISFLNTVIRKIHEELEL